MPKPKTYEVLGFLECIESLKKKVQKFDRKAWEEFTERKIFVDQKDSLTIPLFNLVDRENEVFNKKIQNSAVLELLQPELQQFDQIVVGKHTNHEVKRSMLVLLPSGCNVAKHRDMGHHLTTCHRIHLPIITNSSVDFFVSNTKVPMEEGNVIEINNNVEHYVLNRSSSDRIHLIADYGVISDSYYNAD